MAGGVKVFCCRKIIDELKELMERDFSENLNDNERILTFILTYTELVETIYNVKVIKKGSDDDIIINCALSANANYIVSGDNHLLKLKEYQKIKIISASEFLDLIE